MNIEDYMVYIWLGIVVIAVIVEAVTYELFSIWFAVGAVAGMIAGVLGAQINAQILIAAIVSLVLVIATRPFVNKMLKTKKTNTNADRYVGQTGKVIEEIDNSKPTGLVKVSGSIWTARSENNEIIAPDKSVKVLRIEGVKVIVEPMAENSEKQIEN